MPDEKCPECKAATKPWRFSIEGWTSRTGVECTRCKWFRDAEPFENNERTQTT